MTQSASLVTLIFCEKSYFAIPALSKSIPHILINLLAEEIEVLESRRTGSPMHQADLLKRRMQLEFVDELSKTVSQSPYCALRESS